jgi:hypothetical protein
MENKVMKFGYEDTDKKIEVELYGLVFEINKKKILDKNTDILNSKDEDVVRNEIKEIIGEDSIEKINNKRKADGYDEMTIDVEIAVLTCLYKAYMETSANTLIDGINETANKYTNNDENYNGYKKPYNRYERRYNKRYYRR